jgi:hypothetical protein
VALPVAPEIESVVTNSACYAVLLGGWELLSLGTHISEENLTALLEGTFLYSILMLIK